jgi:hypothetical protein
MRQRTWLWAALLVGGCTFGSTAGSSGVGVGDESTGSASSPDSATTGGGSAATAGTITVGANDATSGGVEPRTMGTTDADDSGLSGGTTSSSGADSSGGEPGVLVDEGLVARYYLDEAAAGQAPPDAFDAAPDPINLTLNYNNGQPNYFQSGATHTGLRFAAATGSGYAGFGNVDHTKFEDVLEAAATTFTIEVCVAIEAVGGPGEPSRVVWLGAPGNNGKMALLAGDTGFSLAINDGIRRTWNPDLQSRHVVHVVVDTMQAAEADRARLYVDGVLVAPSSGMVTEGETLSIPNGAYFLLGNELDDNRSFEGTLYYAAIYDQALSVNDVSNNVDVLMLDDDTPQGS